MMRELHFRLLYLIAVFPTMRTSFELFSSSHDDFKFILFRLFTRLGQSHRYRRSR